MCCDRCIEATVRRRDVLAMDATYAFPALADRIATLAWADLAQHLDAHGAALIPGLLTAEEILDGRATTIDIESLRWSRFDAGVSAGEYNVV